MNNSERLARFIAKHVTHREWDGLGEGTCGHEFRPFGVDGHANARKEDYISLAMDALIILEAEVLP